MLKSSSVAQKRALRKTSKKSPSKTSTQHAQLSTKVPLKKVKKVPTAAASFRSTKPLFAMTKDPLDQHHPEKDPGAPFTYISTRSAQLPVNVLLVGYHSHVGQHLFSHLTRTGFNVYPVARHASHHRDVTAVIPIHMIEEKGLPDVDFIINCQGLNWWNPMHEQREVYETRVGTNKYWAEHIRNTNAKPYAYFTMSSVFQTPPSEHAVYDDTFNLPALSTYLNDKSRCDQFDEFKGFTRIQRLFRDSETHSRVFIPELDRRTPEQIKELAEMKKRYDISKVKMGMNQDVQQLDTPEFRREHSVRNNLLTNDQVRVVNMRHGMLISKTMQEFKHCNNLLQDGKFGSSVDPTVNIPSMHVDDFCQAIIHCMMTSSISGTVNAVTPSPITNTEIIKYIARMNRAWTKPSAMTPGQLASMFGSQELANLFTENRNVVPNVLKDTGFQWEFPSMREMSAAAASSLFEEEIDILGHGNLQRNSQFSIFH